MGFGSTRWLHGQAKGALATLLLCTAGCGSGPCAPGTVRLALTFAGGAEAADAVEVDLTIDRGDPTRHRVARGGRRSTDSLDLTFPAGYPAGRAIALEVTALTGDTRVASAIDEFTAPPGCTTRGLTLIGQRLEGDAGVPADLAVGSDDLAPPPADAAADLALRPCGPEEDAGPGTCAPTWAVRGTVTGLAGTLVLQNTGTDVLTVTANGDFAFTGRLVTGAPYAVTVKSEPSGQRCVTKNGAGTVGTADVTNVAVTCVSAVALAQSWDGVSAPTLPAGWTSTLVVGSGPDQPWKTVTTTPDTAPNAVFANSANHVNDIVLDSPVVHLIADTAQLTFRHRYDSEPGGDGGLLEIRIGAGAFVDLIDAGGAFVTGGYPRAINLNFMSPLRGRNAWTGNSAGYITTTVKLPKAAADQDVVLRWRFACDNATAANGWHVDDVLLTQ